MKNALDEAEPSEELQKALKQLEAELQRQLAEVKKQLERATPKPEASSDDDAP